jgi:hypothetical protein
MSLSPEQTKIVASWVAAGDGLSVIQKRLAEQFKVSMTYMDVRFLVDDLGLELKNAIKSAPGAKVDLAKGRPAEAAQPEKKAGLFDKLKKAVGAGSDETAKVDDPEAAIEDPEMVEEPADDLSAIPAGASNVKVEVDRLVRPGAVVSGSVTFSDGTTAKWALDQLGRLMLDSSKKGYQPPASDVQAFQQELSTQLQRQGY